MNRPTFSRRPNATSHRTQRASRWSLPQERAAWLPIPFGDAQGRTTGGSENSSGAAQDAASTDPQVPHISKGTNGLEGASSPRHREEISMCGLVEKTRSMNKGFPCIDGCSRQNEM